MREIRSRDVSNGVRNRQTLAEDAMSGGHSTIGMLHPDSLGAQAHLTTGAVDGIGHRLPHHARAENWILELVDQ